MTNDRTQVALEREFRKAGYFYSRRRQTKGEIRRLHGKIKASRIIQKGSLAQIVAACDLDAREARIGREKLFGEQMYSRVFPNFDFLFYLPRYWMMWEVCEFARGNKFCWEARWVALQALWKFIGPTLTTDNRRRSFVGMCEKQKQDMTVAIPLNRSIQKLFIGIKKFYSTKKGNGKEISPPATFFKSRNGSGSSFIEFIQQDDAVMNFIQRQKARILSAIG